MKIIIAGCGKMGSELARRLSLKSHKVAIIDLNPGAFTRLVKGFQGKTLQGDVRDRAVLERAGIENADGFAAVTSLDEVNLTVARAARDLYKVPHVVARVKDPLHQQAFDVTALQTISSSAWGGRRMEQFLTQPALIELARFGKGEIILAEVRPDLSREGQPLKILLDGLDASMVAFHREDQTSLALEEFLLQEGDLLLIAISSGDFERLKERLSVEEA